MPSQNRKLNRSPITVTRTPNFRQSDRFLELQQKLQQAQSRSEVEALEDEAYEWARGVGGTAVEAIERELQVAYERVGGLLAGFDRLVIGNSIQEYFGRGEGDRV